MSIPSQPSFDVVLAGLALVDVIGRPIDLQKLPKAGGLTYIDSITMTTGGNVCNCGIDLTKLGFRVAAITRLGDDTLGGFVRHQLQHHGIDDTGVTIDRQLQTSATMVAVRRDGERTFLHTRGCLKNFRADDVLRHLPLIRSTRIFALGYLGLLPECEKGFQRIFSTIKKETRAETFLDTGGTPHAMPGLLKSILPFVDYFIPSFDEAVALTGERTPEAIVQFLRRKGASGVVGVKLGKRGCYIDQGGEASTIPAVQIRKVVDATGAGDAFVAGFIAGVLRGLPIVQAAQVANRIAGSCVTAVGASTAIQPLRTYL
jgi:sugar/nucleoside kinase (ribokinase family)